MRMTSLDARATVNVACTRRIVATAVAIYGPAIDEELFRRAHEMSRGKITPSGFRGRRAELVRLGAIVDTGRRGLTAAGRRSIVWGRGCESISLAAFVLRIDAGEFDR